MSILEEAKSCVNSAPPGAFGIDDIMIAISVFELGFKLWQSCSNSSSAEDAIREANVADSPNGELNFRRAKHRVKVASRRNGVHPSSEQLQAMTAHMLKHVQQTSHASLSACCSEPPIQDESDD